MGKGTQPVSREARSLSTGGPTQDGDLLLGLSAPTYPQLWTPKQAAEAMRVSQRYLRDSDCPKVFLPSTRPGGRSVLRYDPDECRAWWRQWSTTRRND